METCAVPATLRSIDQLHPAKDRRGGGYLPVERQVGIGEHECDDLSPLQRSMAPLRCTPGQENRGGGVGVEVRCRYAFRGGGERTETLRHLRHRTTHAGARLQLDIGEQLGNVKRTDYYGDIF